MDEPAADRRMKVEERARELTGGRMSLRSFRLSRSLKKDNMTPSRRRSPEGILGNSYFDEF